MAPIRMVETSQLINQLLNLREIRIGNDSILVCPDCKHDCLLFEPSIDGACFCGCH